MTNATTTKLHARYESFARRARFSARFDGGTEFARLFAAEALIALLRLKTRRLETGYGVLPLPEAR